MSFSLSVTNPVAVHPTINIITHDCLKLFTWYSIDKTNESLAIYKSI